jgi:hypothetical protein
MCFVDSSGVYETIENHDAVAYCLSKIAKGV